MTRFELATSWSQAKRTQSLGSFTRAWSPNQCDRTDTAGGPEGSASLSESLHPKGLS
jgi:hypothetical protein